MNTLSKLSALRNQMKLHKIQGYFIPHNDAHQVLLCFIHHFFYIFQPKLHFNGRVNILLPVMSGCPTFQASRVPMALDWC